MGKLYIVYVRSLCTCVLGCVHCCLHIEVRRGHWHSAESPSHYPLRQGLSLRLELSCHLASFSNPLTAEVAGVFTRLLCGCLGIWTQVFMGLWQALLPAELPCSMNFQIDVYFWTVESEGAYYKKWHWLWIVSICNWNRYTNKGLRQNKHRAQSCGSCVREYHVLPNGIPPYPPRRWRCSPCLNVSRDGYSPPNRPPIPSCRCWNFRKGTTVRTPKPELVSLQASPWASHTVTPPQLWETAVCLENMKGKICLEGESN